MKMFPGFPLLLAERVGFLCSFVMLNFASLSRTIAKLQPLDASFAKLGYTSPMWPVFPWRVLFSRSFIIPKNLTAMLC